MQNFDMDSIIEYAIEKIKQEIRSVKGSKIKDIDIDDIGCNDRRLSFQVIGYDAKGKPVGDEYFSCSLNFEDAATESEDDIKWLIDNNAPEFAYNFVKNPVRPTLREDAGYNIQFYQIFINPEKPTDNGKMIAQAGTEDEAKAKGDELVGKGNYLIKAVCDDGKVRDVDLHDYFNNSKDLKEYYRGEDALDDVLSWLQDHKQAWDDFTAHFSDVEDEDLTYDMVIDWISEHETLYNDYLAFFNLDESKSINESDDASQEPQVKWCVEIEGDFPAGTTFDTREQAQQWFSNYVKEYNAERADNGEEYTEDDFEVYIYQDIDTVDKDELIKYLADYFEDTYRYEYTYYKRFVGDIVNLLYDVYDLPSYAREDMEYDAYQWAYSMCEILEDKVGPREDDEYEDDDLEESKSMNNGMNTYNVTFYMDSLDDNVMSGPSTTKKIMAASKEEAEKKLRDECNDKYYIPTITDVELVESIVTEELKPGDLVYVTVSNRQGHVLKLIGNDLVEVELDGNWLYPARIDTFYRNEVELIDMSPEFDDEFDDEEDIDPDAVIDSLKEESAEYVAKPSALSRDDMIEHLLDAEDEHEFIFAECDKMIRKYKIEANPDWDLDDILETFTTNQLEELLQKVMNKVQLEEDLGHTVGVALFCTASIEVCTVGGVDEDGEDVEEPTIFDDKTPVNDILNAIDPDTDEGDAKCAEINKLLNAMPDGYIQVQAYCRGRDMGDRQVYDAYELYDEIRDIFNLDESLTESNNAYTYRGHYIINDGSTWMIKDGNNQVIRSGISTDSEAEEIIDDLDESVDYEDAFVADDDM